MLNRSNITFNYAELLSTPKELTGKYVKCAVYGKAGTKKTTLVGTFPNPLVLDTNKGLKVLQNNENVQVISLEHTTRNEAGLETNPNVYKTIIQILDDAKYKKGLFSEGQPLATIETIAIDDMTNLCQFLKYGIMKFTNGKNPEKDKADFDDWSMLSNQLNEIGSRLKNLKYNVIVTAGEKLEMDELKGGQVGGVNIQGSYRHTLPHEFDETYHMIVKTTMGKTQYLTETVDIYPYNAKSRVGVKNLTENITYQKIVETQTKK
jgi:hypothetical protein